ncbi:hypothetical protein COU78_01135 [Candidatus Peregrinibacteria bacterium CG10_big_fil_rev_8_21_14_0_10_49_24]|nr:MAG: hypothetical protein COV83_04095 [Candidatus Peregrinibacteria bacterium CG11_big_fil_rev_8_21_14_0_20_49_14]PIR51330.1 MAG: hypothetical protein COU78_01135 [Candidatus Peregrinibacteria bacterium CG10_big_fil_rev_8_21_14_0_10_49_24]PJA68094.1 MAG: hypothetical protein CO157_00950 [Candidatus Peregrinibacteria bacterium CG_4_9_14_3_um_filter_49_12]
MRFSLSVLTAFTLYALLGICPMQMTMMPSSSEEEMAMMMHGAPMEKGNADDLAIAKKGTCSTCMQAFENLAAKKSETGAAYSTPLLTLAPVLQAPKFEDNFGNRILLTSSARAGPSSLASLIVESVVLRT